MLDLILIVAVSVILVPLVEFTSGAGRVVLGLVFILFSPGYSLIAALFPGKTSIGAIERLALSFGLSIAAVPLIGLVLNYTPLGIRLYPVLLSVLAFIIIMCAIAWYRRTLLDPAERFNLNLKHKTLSLTRSWKSSSVIDKTLNVLLAAAIIGAIGTLGYVVANPKVGERFTEFYILGAQGRADDYPREVKLGTSAWVTAGIINREHEQAYYDVEITVAGIAVKQLGPVTLEHDEIYEAVVTFEPRATGQNQKVEFILYKNGSSEVYLTLHLWINVHA